MFNNIGNKLRTLAIIAFWAQLVAYIAAGICLIAWANAWGTPTALEGPLIGAAIFCFIGGPGISWINSALIYGFGELIAKATAIERNTRPATAPHTAQSGSTPRPAAAPVRANTEDRSEVAKQLRDKGLITEEEYRAVLERSQGGAQ